MYYGYILTNDYLQDYAIEHNLRAVGTPLEFYHAEIDAVRALLLATGVRDIHTVKTDTVPCGLALFLRIAHNKSEKGLQLKTKEHVERFKSAMGVTEDPEWCRPG